MLTDITNQFDHMISRVQNSELLTDPWPHMFITDIIKPDYYRKFCEFELAEGMNKSEEEGRVQYTLDLTTFSEYQVKYFNKKSNQLFHAIAEKFGLVFENEFVPQTTNFWLDTKDLLIDDIHIDAFKDTMFTLSGLIYLPKDISQKQYGSKLYSYVGNNIAEHAVKDEGTQHHHTALWDHVDQFELKRTLPFLPNCMFIAPNFDNTWHQAPTNIADGDVRKSCMFRWKV